MLKQIVLVLAAAVILSAAAFWAGGRLTDTGFTSESGRSFTTVAARQGNLERHLNLNVVAAWPTGASAVNRAVGVITSVELTPGKDVRPGDVLYSVNLRPVLIANGSVPMFRDLQIGAIGPDVAQVETLLRDMNLFSGTPNDLFTVDTRDSVIQLQRALGLEPDGVVHASDLIFAAIGAGDRVRLDPQVINVGASLVGGEHVLSVLPSSPTFSLPVTASQASLIPTSTMVHIKIRSGRTWEAVTGGSLANADSGTTVISLKSVKPHEPICRLVCSMVALEGESTFEARIILLKRTPGVTVPSSALTTNVGGSVDLTYADGARHGVDVIAQANGLAIVDGVSAGTRVRVPADPRE